MTDFEFLDTDNGEYALIAAGGNVIIDATRICWKGDDLVGEVTISAEGTQYGPFAVAFLKPSSRRDAVADFRDNHTIVAALNELCRNVVACERQNTTSPVRLCETTRPSPDREYAIDLLPSVPRHHMAIWFGDGGAGKSLIALYAAGQLARQGVRTLYLDWELEEGEHRLRYEQIFGEAMPTNLWYWRCDKPLLQIGDGVRREIKKRERQIDYLVVDSIAYACGGGVESADASTSYANLVRSFGIGSLHLAHVTKNGEAAKQKPFGSVFWHSSARSTWYFEAKGTTEGENEDTTRLTLYHRKSNFSALQKEPRLLQYTIGKDRGPVRLAYRLPFKESTRLTDRIKAAVELGPMTREELRHRLGTADPETVKRTIRRGLETGWLTERKGRLALAAAKAA